MKELFIDRGITQSRAAVFKDGRLLDLYIENYDFYSLSGNVYKGRIENIVFGLNAAFINIGLNKNAILHFENENQLRKLKRGQDLIVQVIRESTGEKGPRVTTEISIPGKYIVLLPGEDYIGVSKKIENPEARKRIKDIIQGTYEKGYGVIVRTEGMDIDEYDLCNDYIEIKSMWKDIENRSTFMRAPQLIFNSKDFYELVLREYVKTDIDKIHMNREKDIDYLNEKFDRIDESFMRKIIFNDYNFTMQDLIEKEILRSNLRRINLTSGGYIIVDYAEAFTCIDVNSGSYIGSINSEETILKVNLEACGEIANIIKIRNISGVILIDFIDMKSDENKRTVLEAIDNEFSHDRSKFKVYGFTRLGILETARGKKGKRIDEFIFSNENNSNYGEGEVKIQCYGEKRHMNPSYCLKLVENKCLKEFKHYKRSRFEVYLAEYIYNEIYNFIPTFVNEMKNIYGITINLLCSKVINDFTISEG